MSETKMPAAEAAVAVAHDDERNSYEFAFHVLPTVAEGEVAGVFDKIKAHITKAGGEILDEEAPQRIDLAYDIVKHIEGKNRKFHSAYFGWTRFKLASEAIEALDEELEGDANILRALMLRLTRIEEESPFRYHEAHKESKVKVVDEGESLGEDTPAVAEVAEATEEAKAEEVVEEKD
ncbi:30S ribosomal protein S6 [Candidatus Parcubacteria bacterium]|uniref:Small ribosomal subunit protein bS6 n=1 Tax=Candidatus Kaiserbacteria bacterium CG10_big_fil_rev_8_21_14_0_10_47_16 TaxID=1974608 RepID=A0A2H0UEK1_9BACT|nr:30S ribosomal protein S6 [Candidatus Parcubacteria bacterium]PIR84839.1 MAG: hypothetical protein COU16_00425 [Candidatus Kaiserbacteria bacterium CG10_big_fil_rev_8_21_14_0_10_47_16]